MKALAIITLLFCTCAFAQENPWENRETENPWATETAKTTEQPEVEKKDSTVKKVELDTATEVAPTNAKIMYRNAETESRENYNANNDFAFGFASGLFFNVFGTVADMAYTIPDSKREKAAVEKTITDSSYVTLDDQELTKKTKSAVKSKKFLATLGGTVLGSLVQFGAIIVISLSL